MQKFSNMEEKEQLKLVNPKINKLVEKLISLNLSVSYSGDSNDIIGKNIKIDGIDNLVEKLESLKEWTIVDGMNKLTEKLKYSGIINDQETINKEIELLKESKHDSIIFSPEDIFEASDYKKSNKMFVFESMKSIPIDYMSRINLLETDDYFSKGNKITIIYEGINKGWNVAFNSNDTYGTSVDDEETKYDYFVKENSEFIADFVAATTELIGAKKLTLEKRLIK